MGILQVDNHATACEALSAALNRREVAASILAQVAQTRPGGAGW